MMNAGMLNAGGAYGAGKAGQAFNILAFVQRPQVILRVVSVLFAIIVFGCISSEGYLDDKCIINDSSVCGFTVGVGVLAFLGGLALLALEARFENISSIKIRRRAVIGDLAFTGVWAFLWFITFCYLVNQWSNTEAEELPGGYGTTNAQAAIAFSFFSAFVWGGLAYFSYMRYRQGAANAFAPGGLEGTDGVGGMPRGGYTSYPGAPDDHYQEPAFGAPAQKDGQGFQSPAY